MSISSKLTTKYQVTLPSYVRESLGIKPSDKVTFSINLKNEVVLKRVKSLDEVMGSIKSSKPIDEVDVHKIAREHVVDLYKKKWHLE